MRIRPDMPLSLCTGFSEQISEESAKVLGIREFNFYPRVMGKLTTTVRALLDERKIVVMNPDSDRK
jgi:hypothetical protein